MWFQQTGGYTKVRLPGLPEADGIIGGKDHPAALHVAMWGDQVLHIAMLAQNYGAVLNTVAQSNLIAMVSERMLKSSRNPLALQILEPPLKLPDMRMNLFWHERTHKDPRHRWFRQLITAVAREL